MPDDLIGKFKIVEDISKDDYTNVSVYLKITVHEIDTGGGRDVSPDEFLRISILEASIYAVIEVLLFIFQFFVRHNNSLFRQRRSDGQQLWLVLYRLSRILRVHVGSRYGWSRISAGSDIFH